MFKKALLFFVVGVSLSLTGCAAGPKYIIKDYQPPLKVAVLPFANETNDLTGPEMVRKVLMERLPSKGYQIESRERVDQILLDEFGVTEGGQLGSVKPKVLGKILGVDGLLYGNVLDFVDIPLGFTRKRRVKVNLQLISAEYEERLWEDERSWFKPELYLNAKDARDAAIRQVAERQLEKMQGTFLKKESEIVVDMLLNNLPKAR